MIISRYVYLLSQLYEIKSSHPTLRSIHSQSCSGALCPNLVFTLVRAERAQASRSANEFQSERKQFDMKWFFGSRGQPLHRMAMSTHRSEPQGLESRYFTVFVSENQIAFAVASISRSRLLLRTSAKLRLGSNDHISSTSNAHLCLENCEQLERQRRSIVPRKTISFPAGVHRNRFERIKHRSYLPAASIGQLTGSCLLSKGFDLLLVDPW